MFDAVKDVIAAGALQLFEDLLWEWTGVIKRVVRVWGQEDVPWWYNERASLSLFAGAIWKAGGIAFEEFSSEREHLPSEDLTEVVLQRGRIDLYFSYRGEEFVAEAKQCWPRIGRRAQSAQAEIEYALQQAVAAVQTAQEVYGQRLAIVFASPYFPQAELQEAHACLTKWQQAVAGVACDCKAVYWLHECPWAQDEGAIYPGGAVFIKQVTAR